MKTLLFAGLAGILAAAPGAAIAAGDSASMPSGAEALVDLSFASPAALASASQGAKMPMPKMGGQKMGGHQMKQMGQIRQMRGQNMKNGGGNRGGSYVRQGRMGYGNGYNRPHRGFQLPQTFVQPSYFIGNFGYYGLSQPSVGYGWSRYYDDAVLTDRRGVVYDTRRDIDWDRYNQGYNDGYQAGQATYDQNVFYGDDRVVASPSGYHSGASYQGDWNGAYREDGSYQGDWQGTYRGADGRTYEGEYSGTFIGEGNMTPHWGNSAQRPSGCDIDPGYSPEACGIRTEPPRYQTYPDYDRGDRDELAYLESCKKSSGIGGAVVGGAIGALAGNRIAGRGNRLGGSLIGGGLGAVAGAAIDQGTDRCRKLLKKYGYDRGHQGNSHNGGQVQHHARPQYPQGYPQQSYPSGWQGGYYYPAYYYQQQAPTITTITVQAQPVTTTTTTTYIEEEVIYEKAHRAPSKKLYKPAAKRVWKPRPAPQPILKGCQQAHC